MPAPQSKATNGFWSKIPTITSVSPMKLEVPGKPTFPSVNKKRGYQK